MVKLTNTAQLLYEIACRELEIEKDRKENIETKANRFVLFGGILFSIISAYFFVSFDKIINKFYLVFLLISLISLAISIFFFIYCLKTYKYTYFNMKELIIFGHSLEYDVIIKRLTGTFSKYIHQRRVKNDKKVKFLYIGIRVFFIGLILMIFGIFFFMFNL